MIDGWTIIFPKLIHTGPIQTFYKVWTTPFSQKKSLNYNYLKLFNLDDNPGLDDNFPKTFSDSRMTNPP